MFGFKFSRRQKRKLTKYPTLDMDIPNDNEVFNNIPTVSQIASLSKDDSNDIIPIFSYDRLDSSNSIDAAHQLSSTTGSTTVLKSVGYCRKLMTLSY